MEQESLFYWTGEPYTLQYGFPRKNATGKIVSAYTVAELGEMMPNPLNKITENLWFTSQLVGGYWEVGCKAEVNEFIPTFEAKTEADARAKFLVYLKKISFYERKITGDN